MEAAGFSFPRLLDLIASASATPDNIQYGPFCDLMIEFSKAFASMGRALSFAFSDITSKAEIIRGKFSSTQWSGLQEMVREEIRLGVEREHGDHPSTARTLLRLMWFLNFLQSIISNLITDKASKLSAITQHAYDESLAPHHPWPVRLGAAIGIKTVPKRTAFVAHLFGEGRSEAEYDAMLGQIAQGTLPLRNALWGFYESNRLTGLP